MRYSVPRRKELKTIRNPLQTRERLLQTALQEMHAHGFQGMRVDEVIRLSGLQKGAFYHHFGSKSELGYAVLREQIKPLVESVWFTPFLEVKDPIQDIPQLLGTIVERIPASMQKHGCPLNNLAQEMSSQDEVFRQYIAELFGQWIDLLETVFDTGKQNGYVRDDVDSRAVSRFIVAALEGSISVFKVDHSMEQWAACRSQIAAYLSTLKPVDS